jgi:hypothetical protein
MASTTDGPETVEEVPGGEDERVLKMDFAGSLVKHLGLQMYSGAVPAIAELIANSYDADADHVTVEIPLDEPFTATSEIVIRDDGTGMTFDDLNTKYLVVGRDRRQNGPDKTKKGRYVLGRKGLGKLAGFGIAKTVTMTTVKDGWLTSFEMEYDEIVKIEAGGYPPTVLEDRAVDPAEGLEDGTEIRLSGLQLKNRIAKESFLRSMGRRFSILSSAFEVTINGETLEADRTDLQFRYPETGVDAEDIDGVGTVTWWVGFTEKPIKNDDIRGVSVLSRGKLVQTPFFFELSGGTQNQLGLQYITGQVFVDGLDAYGEDLIATDRATVLWEHPIAQPLLQWGQRMLRDALSKWAAARAETQKARLRDATPYMDRIEKFPPRQQQEIIRAIDTLARQSTIEDDRLDEIVQILLNAYENEQFFALLKELSQLSADSQASLVELISEWDVLEAIQTAQIIRGRVTVVQTLRRLIDERAPEKPVMQDLLRDHPWLIDPSWDMLHHERSLERVLRETFHGGVNEGDQRRLDFLCIADTSTAVVVEVKRPGLAIGSEELRQLQSYVNTLQDRNDSAPNAPTQRTRFIGVMIYSHMSNEPGINSLVRELGEQRYRIQTWDHLLEAAERAHRDFLDVIKERAPEDPRIAAIEELEEPVVTPAATVHAETAPADANAPAAATAEAEIAPVATEATPAAPAARPAAPRPSAPTKPPPWAPPPAG